MLRLGQQRMACQAAWLPRTLSEWLPSEPCPRRIALCPKSCVGGRASTRSIYLIHLICQGGLVPRLLATGASTRHLPTGLPSPWYLHISSSPNLCQGYPSGGPCARGSSEWLSRPLQARLKPHVRRLEEPNRTSEWRPQVNTRSCVKQGRASTRSIYLIYLIYFICLQHLPIRGIYSPFGGCTLVVSSHFLVSKSVQTLPNVSKCARMSPNFAECARMCPNVSESVRMCPNGSRLLQARLLQARLKPHVRRLEELQNRASEQGLRRPEGREYEAVNTRS